MNWLGFIGSILGGLIGGLFTFFGVKATLRHEDEKRAKEEFEKTEHEKPRLEIAAYSDLKKAAESKAEKTDWDIVVLSINGFENKDWRAWFFYDEAALKLENLDFVEYELVNSGLTEIQDLCATCNLPRSISIFELDDREVNIKNHLLNYEAWGKKRYVKPKEIIKLRVYYIRDKIVVSNIGSPVLTLWLRDVKGNLWSQSLYAPGKQLEISRRRSYEDFKGSRDIETAIRCFSGRLPW